MIHMNLKKEGEDLLSNVKCFVFWVLPVGTACKKLVYPVKRSHYKDIDIVWFTSYPEITQGNN